jgi:hypothetical protein
VLEVVACCASNPKVCDHRNAAATAMFYMLSTSCDVQHRL